MSALASWVRNCGRSNRYRVASVLPCAVSLPMDSNAMNSDGKPALEPAQGYYDKQHLPRFSEMGKDAPELWEKFSAWYTAVFAEGALSEREKALIALAVSHAVQCPYCIDAYSTTCLEKGADRQQMTEAVHVAAAIRGGASLVHGLQMHDHVGKVSM
jgi:alkylhydroperoxidase/carboxymuconolactone decarboxylase family protein